MTRWNSLCRTIDAITRMAPAFTKLLEEGTFAGDLEEKIPNANILKSMAQILNPLLRIKRVSQILQGDEKPTLQHVVPVLEQLCNLIKTPAFNVSSKTTQAFIELFELKLRQRIDNYGREIPQFAIANFLHPHFKGAGLNADNNKTYLPKTKE